MSAATTQLIFVFFLLISFHNFIFNVDNSNYVIAQQPVNEKCNGIPSPNAMPNQLPFSNGNFMLKNIVPNGKLYHIYYNSSDNLNNYFRLIHVYGNASEMGYAYGTLMANELQIFLPQLWSYLENNFVNGTIFDKLPHWLKQLMSDIGLDIALDLIYDVTKEYIPNHFIDELKAISLASRVDYKLLTKLHMLIEVTKAYGSMLGCYRSATQDGNTIQLRSLDWFDLNSPIKNFPAITVYHPNKKMAIKTGNVNDFINIGFVGWIGSITGMSSKQMGISEIGVSLPDSSFGEESRFGIPYAFILRDILQFDITLDDAINRITSSKRTIDLILGVGDDKLQSFKGFQYSGSVAKVIDDFNLMPNNRTWHPLILNCVYFAIDWICPGYSKVLANQIQTYWGGITAETVARFIVPKTQTGNLQVAIYDLTQMKLLVSFAATDKEKNDLRKNAYERGYYTLDVRSLLNESFKRVV
ncbi:hypothetical protein ABK040_009090 [Willaertia magna]